MTEREKKKERRNKRVHTQVNQYNENVIKKKKERKEIISDKRKCDLTPHSKAQMS